jgi:threonine aldolase
VAFSVLGIYSNGGIFTARQLEEAIRPADNICAPRSRLVSIEQTTNLGGGRVWPLDTIRQLLGVVRARSIRAHLDGARLMNAVVASGRPAADYAVGFDTAWIDFTSTATPTSPTCERSRFDERPASAHTGDHHVRH